MSGKSSNLRFWLLLIIILLLNLITAFGQTTYQISGHVKDSLGQPVVASQVIVYGGEELTSIVAFSTTNVAGRYTLTVSSSSAPLRISVLALGYEEQQLDLKLSTKTRIEIDFSLRPRFYELEAVEVRVERNTQRIRPSDTISFSAAELRLGNERNVEELIDRIPGAEVAENGRISIQGKPVSRILLEGDDLTGNNYQLASRGISAHLIDSLEVIDNYLESSILSGVLTSDELVINLKMVPDIGLRLSGETELGTGWPRPVDSRFNGFSLSGQMKLLLLGKWTSTGVRPGLVAEDWYENDVDELISYPSSWRTSGELFAVSHPAEQLPSSEWANFNQALATSIGASWRPNARWKTKALLSISRAKEQAANTTDQQYVLPGELLGVRELNELSIRSHGYTGRLSSEYRLARKMAVQLRMEGAWLPLARKGELKSQSATVLDLQAWEARLQTHRWEGDLRWLWRINPYQAMLLSAQSGTGAHNSEFYAHSDRYRELLAIDTLSGQYRQQARTNAQRRDLRWAWLYNRKQWAVEQVLAYRSEGEFIQQSPFANYWDSTASLTWREWYWQQQCSRRQGPLLLELETTFSHLTVRQRVGGEHGVQSPAGWVLRMHLHAALELGAHSTLLGDFRHGPQAVDPLNMIGSGLLRGLRIWQAQPSSYSLQYQQSAALYWRFRQESKGLALHASVYLDWADKQYAQAADYTALVDQVNWQLGGGYRNAGFSFSGEKYLFNWATAIHLRYRLNSLRQPWQLVNE